MTARLTTRQVGDVSIVDVAGRVTVGGGSNALRETLCELTSRGKKMILVNLCEISYIDSSGIGELVSAFPDETRRQDGCGDIAGTRRRRNKVGWSADVIACICGPLDGETSGWVTIGVAVGEKYDHIQSAGLTDGQDLLIRHPERRLGSSLSAADHGADCLLQGRALSLEV